MDVRHAWRLAPRGRAITEKPTVRKGLTLATVTLLVLVADSGYISNGAIIPPLVTF